MGISKELDKGMSKDKGKWDSHDLIPHLSSDGHEVIAFFF